MVAAPTNGWCDKQQFTTLLSQTEKHKIFLEFFTACVSFASIFVLYLVNRIKWDTFRFLEVLVITLAPWSRENSGKGIRI